MLLTQHKEAASCRRRPCNVVFNYCHQPHVVPNKAYPVLLLRSTDVTRTPSCCIFHFFACLCFCPATLASVHFFPVELLLTSSSLMFSTACQWDTTWCTGRNGGTHQRQMLSSSPTSCFQALFLGPTSL